MTDDAWHDLLANVLDYARTRGAIKRQSLEREFSGMSDTLFDLLPLPHKDKVIMLAGKQQGVQRGRPGAPDPDESDTDTNIPLAGTHGRMLNYMQRLCAHQQLSVDPVGLLREVWDALNVGAEDSCKQWLKKTTREAGLQIDLKKLQFKALLNGPPYIEPVTGRVHFRSVLGVSPQPDNPHSLRLTRPREINPRISNHVERAILWAMSLHPDDRPNNVIEFRDALLGKHEIPERADLNQTSFDIPNFSIFPEEQIAGYTGFGVIPARLDHNPVEIIF